MKAITVWQPFASLIAEGVKSIETRPKRSPWSSAIGETIAIHASKKRPSAFWLNTWADDDGRSWAPEPWRSCDLDLDGWFNAEESIDGDGQYRYDYRWSMFPLGAVVATCTLVDVVPMVDDDDDLTEDPAIKSVLALNEKQLSHDDPELWERCRIHVAGRDDFDGWQRTKTLYDQRPFGDFAPGRWALLLDNIVKTVPAPCRGYQGLWTLPPEVSENLLGLAA